MWSQETRFDQNQTAGQKGRFGDAEKTAAQANPARGRHSRMTAISNASDLAHFDRAFAATNRLRLRTDGVDYLLAAARESGARRFIAQSLGD
jgi:hypothetical protein